MRIHAARRYVSPRSRPLTPEEQETRWISYRLKDCSSPDSTLARRVAAPEMAALVTGPCNLVPIPGRLGNTAANRQLANEIALRVGGARVIDCLYRTAPVASTCDRHKARRGGLPASRHNMARNPSTWLEALPTYLVDNVITSGNTLRAARRALGFGDGLVFSDAGRRPEFANQPWPYGRKGEDP